MLRYEQITLRKQRTCLHLACRLQSKSKTRFPRHERREASALVQVLLFGFILQISNAHNIIYKLLKLIELLAAAKFGYRMRDEDVALVILLYFFLQIARKFP